MAAMVSTEALRRLAFLAGGNGGRGTGAPTMWAPTWYGGGGRRTLAWTAQTCCGAVDFMAPYSPSHGIAVSQYVSRVTEGFALGPRRDRPRGPRSPLGRWCRCVRRPRGGGRGGWTVTWIVELGTLAGADDERRGGRRRLRDAVGPGAAARGDDLVVADEEAAQRLLHEGEH